MDPRPLCDAAAPAGTAAGAPAPPSRIQSLDALRGFDMAFILGGSQAILGVCAFFGLDGLRETLAGWFEHPEWNGFTPWDLIFPLFLFLAGVSLPLSFAARTAKGVGKGELALHAVRRGLTLCLLGLVYNGLLGPDEPELRYASVLARIGLAWMGAALISLAVRRWGALLAAAVGVMLLHSVLLLFVAAPGLDAPSLAPGETIHDWIDRQIVPGRLFMKVRDPEGLAGVVPAIGTALLGALAGRWLMHARAAGRSASAGLALFGLPCLAAGLLGELLGVPINKNLWTASFVCWAAGWSFLLLALFHWVIDERGFRRLGLVFAVIGANAILAYLMTPFISFAGIAEVVLARGLARNRLDPALLPLVGLMIQWALLFVLYRRRIFLRV